jgi:hypothetical protein
MIPHAVNVLQPRRPSVSWSSLCNAKPKEKPREGTGLSGPHRVNKFGNSSVGCKHDPMRE